MAQISFELVTPAGLIFQEDVYSVQLPTPQGEIGVLPHHRHLITLITPGVIAIRRREASDEVEHVATAGGFAEVSGRRVRVLADVAEHADDIDELKAKEALERAQELRRTAKDQVSLADATSLIEHNVARLKVAELRRRRQRRIDTR